MVLHHSETQGTHVVLGQCIHIGSILDEQPRRFQTPKVACQMKRGSWMNAFDHTHRFNLSRAFTFSRLVKSLIISSTLFSLANPWRDFTGAAPSLILQGKTERQGRFVDNSFSSLSMQTDPQELERLLLKRKSNTGPFPTIDSIPNKESYKFLVNPPVK